MSDGKHILRCKLCGSQTYMVRFQSTVTDSGISREHAYECLWCEETEKVILHLPQRVEARQLSFDSTRALQT